MLLFYVENHSTFERSKPFALREMAETEAKRLGVEWKVIQK